MNKKMQNILIDIFPLIVEVNFTTKYKIDFDIQPCFNTDQIWYQVSDNDNDFGHTRTTWWNKEAQFKKDMAKFKKELQQILKRNKSEVAL